MKSLRAHLNEMTFLGSKRKPSSMAAWHCVFCMAPKKKIADPLLWEPLTFFESRYDHQYIDEEILQLAGAAVDRRILRGVVAKTEDTEEKPRGSAGRRKL